LRERRSKDRIILEVLNICAEGECITRIVYRASTNFTTARAYLDMLIENGLVEPLQQGSLTLYKTTQKGIQVRNRLKMLHDELEIMNL
jgi:predicted transcriptional regulator